MTDSHGGHGQDGAPATGAPGAPGAIDHEIDVRHIIEVGIWLAGTAIVSFVIGYGLYLVLDRFERKQDPAPSPIPQANVPRAEPEPHLQMFPVREFQAMRAAEEERLQSYGWLDKSQGIAHIPIDRAIELAAEEAARITTPPAAAPAAPAPAPAPAKAEKKGPPPR